MNQQERDELLIRIDERTKNIEEKTDKQEKHLEELNGQVRTNTTFRKVGTWVSGAVVVGLISLAVALIAG